MGGVNHLLSATWERWEVEGRGVPELLPWVAEGGDRCFALVADFEFRYRLNTTKMNNFLGENSTSRKFIYDCSFDSEIIFLTEKSTYEEVLADGDYYIDHTNGIVFSYSLAVGGAYFSYRDFPYVLSWQPVKVLPLYDSDIHHITRDYLIDDSTGIISSSVISDNHAGVGGGVYSNINRVVVNSTITKNSVVYEVGFSKCPCISWRVLFRVLLLACFSLLFHSL